jgi:M6 family metalloprotease-like protein
MPLTLLLGVVILAPSAPAQPVSPAPGVEVSPEVLESLRSRGMFEFKHAWIEKTRKTREARDAYMAERGFYKREMLQPAQRRELAVTGNFAIPVFCVKWGTTGADPFPTSSLQTKLFDGPFAPQTLTEFYDEISYGDLNMTGTVYGWHTLANTKAFYVGTGTCNGLGTCGNMDDLITQTIVANDGAVNFGQYDNDGPDGLPNSGDDDGYVDFVAFVHPDRGAECGVNGNLWSHRFSLSGWAASGEGNPGPIATNDARTGGGLIMVDDYVVQPIKNCDNVSLIDIGVFCHEFGHAFGLPDLYDTNGGSQGVGHWCLMGSGNWNLPTLPAHMSAWSKDQLGWANVIVSPSAPTPFVLNDVETNRDVYRLDVTRERWRRMNTCNTDGLWSMWCGLTAAEALLRNYGSGAGYGNNWQTTVSRDFEYDGVGSVELEYQYSFNLEPSYDYVYGEITVGATTSTFAIYDGVGADVATIDLTPYLSGPTSYKISFRMESDGAWSDEDALYPTACGAMALDLISVTGGGENYFTDFELREDGWAEEMNPPAEYFLVENRQPLGSDVNVAGGGGLSIWHIDSGDQTGGPANNRPRGVAVEQADGLGNLEANLNRGDAGDPYPGSTNNMNFNGLTVPNSNGHDGPSSVSVQLTSGNGNPMTATMQGGWAAPVPTTVAPNTAASGNLVQLQIDGSLFAKTGNVELVGASTIAATSVEWIGKDRILADFDLTGAGSGLYDVVVYNPGGSNAMLDDAFEITGAPTAAGDLPAKFALLPNYPNPFNPATTIRYEIASRTQVELRVFDVSGALVRTLVNESKAPGAYSLQWNGRDDRGTAVSSGVYFYRITAGDFTDVRKMTLLK